jgi:hypothetical protein
VGGAGPSRLKRIRLHDLRHSYCTMAVPAWSLHEVRGYADDANTTTTLRYVHHIPAHDAAERLSAIVAAATVPQSVPPTTEIEANSAQLRETKSLQIDTSAIGILES